MRGSIGGGSYGLGRGATGGGGSGGGGGMLRTVGRVVRTGLNGLQDPLPSSSHNSPTSPSKKSTTTNAQNCTSSKHALILSNPSVSSQDNCFTVSAAWPLSPSFCNDCELGQWEYVENYDDGVQNESGFCFGYGGGGGFDHVFGTVPSAHEVEQALLSLRQVFHPSSSYREIPSDLDKDAAYVAQRASSVGPDMDWVEPSMQIYDQRLTQSCRLERVYDSFHLVQTEPSVQKMVVSLSTDKAVWDAVMNNEAVREIRDSYQKASETSPQSFDENCDPS